MWDVYSSHRDSALLAKLKQKYPNLLIVFVPSSCTSELQPLDVEFNGPWKCCITWIAADWLSVSIGEQLNRGVDPAKVTLNTNKSDLVAPFCQWLAAATAEMKTPAKRQQLLRSWQKTGVMIAWDFGSAEHQRILADAKTKQDRNELWSPDSARLHANGSIPATKIVFAGGIDAIFRSALNVEAQVEPPECEVNLTTLRFSQAAAVTGDGGTPSYQADCACQKKTGTAGGKIDL